MDNNQLEVIKKFYIDQGIVTRNDHPNLDSRPFSRELKQSMRDIGFKDAAYIEHFIKNYQDYSYAIYDPCVYTDEEARAYMEKYVLHV